MHLLLIYYSGEATNFLMWLNHTCMSYTFRDRFYCLCCKGSPEHQFIFSDNLMLFRECTSIYIQIHQGTIFFIFISLQIPSSRV